MTICSKKNVMSKEEYELLRDLVERETGIVMKHDRRLTLHAKVSHRLMLLGLSTYKAYYDFIVSDPAREELHTLASHVASSETYFFRERPQFQLFAELLPEIKQEKQEKGLNILRVLCLACSSGEEVYSLNILIRESDIFTPDWDIRITAMDIGRSALEKARNACYTGNSFRPFGESEDFIKEYFDVEAGRYTLRKAYRSNLEFRYGNILSPSSFEGIDEMDVIFCRNVLVYMSDEAFGKIVRNCYNKLSAAGYLFVGASESLIRKTDLFYPEYRQGAIIYRKNLNCCSLPANEGLREGPG